MFPAGGRGTFRPKFIALLLFALSLFIQTLSAQVPPSQQKKAPQGNSAPPADTPPPPPAQIWLPPLQNPEHAPVIEWDGRLLTIDAENSSLADVMLGIRSRTGASIDMPASANRERIAVHLGPAPIREVLSSLLYGTDFNYVVQSSEDDQDALGKVILIPRDGDSSSSQDLVADEGRPKSKIRLMPGYAAPGKRDFEVAHSRATEDSSSPVADTPVAETPVVDSASATPDQPAGATVADSASANASTDAQPATSESADSSSPDTNSSMLTASGQPSTGTAAISSNSSSSTGGGSTIGEMEQNLQNLYKQRQQLQAQQNRTITPPQTNAP
jgi:hypothetical protein